MTTGPAASRLQDDSLLGVSASLVAAVAAGFLCKWAGLPEQATTAVSVSAGSVAAAVALRIKSLRRDPRVDIARIERGELRRPVGLVVLLLAAAIVLLDSAAGAMEVETADRIQRLANVAKLGMSTVHVLDSLVDAYPLILGMCFFLVACYASHYFAKRPYLWTATAVICALAVRELVVLAFRSTSAVKSLTAGDELGSLAGLLAFEVLSYLAIFVTCMVGAWFGGRHHDAFLAKKLARMEGKAARRRQSTPQNQTTETPAALRASNASQDAAPKLATFVSPSGLPSAPDDRRTSDPIKQIEKLAHLRDAGALTEEEFQAKKTEILCRI